MNPLFNDWIITFGRYSEIKMELVKFGHPSLNKRCERIEKFDIELHALLDGMKKIMEENKGIGIAANQTGFNLRAFLVKTVKGDIVEMVNPVITDTEGFIVMPEGCLSAPGVNLSLGRPEYVVVVYQDRNGEHHRVMAEGIEARIILHENEHLDGKNFLNNVNRKERKKAISKSKK